MESSDEDDKFLYGSDNEDPNVTSQKLKKVDEINNSKQPIPNGKEDDDDDDNVIPEDEVEEEEEDVDGAVGEEDSPQQSDEDTNLSNGEYNIEFIVSMGPDSSRLDSRSNNIINTQTVGQTISVVPTETTDSTTTTTATTAATTTTAATATDKTGVDLKGTEEGTLESNGQKVNIEAGSIDLDKDGLFDGRPITEIDPEVLKEKPWRQPGANLSDYFNYGFNEFTWTEYLHRQERLRDEYNPRRILMGLLTLQQQGKLDIKTNFDPNGNNNSNLNNRNKIEKPPVMNAQPPVIPQGFPPMPMFGGFPPFGMPGMMPMNPQQNMNNSNNSNNNNNPNNRNQQR